VPIERNLLPLLIAMHAETEGRLDLARRCHRQEAFAPAATLRKQCRSLSALNERSLSVVAAHLDLDDAREAPFATRWQDVSLHVPTHGR
jgi:hypothetical protein